MTDPTPKPVWVSAIAARHVQESTPDESTDPPTWPEDGDFVLIDGEEWYPGSVGYTLAQAWRRELERAERAESNARGKQAVIEAQRATLDRVRALPLQWAQDWRDAPTVDRVLRKITADLCLALDAPQPEAGGDDE